MSRFRDPNLSEKLAAVLLLHLKVPRDVAKTMTVSQILALVQWDHYPVASNAARDLGWTADQANHPSNLQPLPPAEHLLKTRKIDTPQAAKGKRLTKDHEEHRRRMLSPMPRQERPSSAWPKGRKMPSRPFRKDK